MVTTGTLYVGNGTILRREGVASHKGDTLGFPKYCSGEKRTAGDAVKYETIEYEMINATAMGSPKYHVNER